MRGFQNLDLDNFALGTITSDDDFDETTTMSIEFFFFFNCFIIRKSFITCQHQLQESWSNQMVYSNKLGIAPYNKEV